MTGNTAGYPRIEHFDDYQKPETTMNSVSKILYLPLVLMLAVGISSCKKNATEPTTDGRPGPTNTLVMDHQATTLVSIPSAWIAKAKSDLRIAYGHTSHGSQLVTGMSGLVTWKGSLYRFNSTGADSALQLRDTPFSGASDLGNPDRTTWAVATRNYLDVNPTINVVMWSWCGQVSSASSGDIDLYLQLMNALESQYPSVRFVYMTGHLDGTGLTGNLHLRNEQIRAYCRANSKVLYDFADIESYDPDGVYYGDKRPNDNCDYDSDGNGSLDKNWAVDWQNAHPGQWYDCSSAHSQPLNANRKAYAAWALFARLAGWSGS